MDCQHCGAPLSAGATTCSSCGADVPTAAGGTGQPTPPSGSPPGAHPSGSPPGAHPSGSPPGAHPSGLSSEVRNWAMAAHLSAFLGSFVAIALLGPLIVWLIRREVDGFSEQHAREALNFNITFLLVLVVGGVGGTVLAVLTLGIALIVVLPLLLAVVVGWIVLTIIAAVRASEGREYRYPFTIRFVS
jgi:uncharacterized protein